ncbi:MAG TPA: DUF899 domain-containing protein [Jatrophihabitans sp.]|nr:DUF899 domain-containing protein [Jatrophihabitans sp.]
MTLPQVVTREEWVIRRKELLAKEKQLTRSIDAVNADRRRLPMVRIDKPYRFEGAQGQVGLAELFDGCRQLIVQHVMWLFEPDVGCPSCSASLDEISEGMLHHIRARDTAFAVISRGPFASLQRYRDSKGWTMPWYSSFGSDFNYDFHVTLDESVLPVEYNYRSKAELEAAGQGLVEPGRSSEQPGISCFLRDQDEVFHTYSTFARGADHLGGAYAFLDLTALGRQEEWEEPKDRVAKPWSAVPDFSE